MNLKITKEELEAIRIYKDEKYEQINQQLIEDAETDINLISSGKNIEYSKNAVINNINIIKKLYEAIIKFSIQNDKNEKWSFFRGTNIAEIEKLRANSDINNFLLSTIYKQEAKAQVPANYGRPALMQIDGDEKIPYINLKDILEDSENDVIIAPFTKVISITADTWNEELSANWNSYVIKLENQELEEMTDNETKKLYDEIISDSENISKKIKECIDLEEENIVHYENIRKLEQLLVKHNMAMEEENYDTDSTPEEKQADLDDIARINMELDVLKDTSTEVFEIRKEKLNFIQNWKKNVIKYLKSECKKISDKYIIQKEDKIEDENVSQEETTVNSIPIDDPVANEVKAECAENIAMVNTLLNNIKQLISKQQNHARIADEIDSNYKALNNAFEMKNYAEELDSLVRMISDKVNIVYKDKEKLEKISKTNIQISTLINYINNPKSAVSKKISRFDEMNIIEENELKREIAETIKNIRCEAELKKLRDDIDIIEDKSKFKKFIGKITGRNKIDKTMLDQIQVRQTAIRKTFKNKMPLAYNYSIHELIAEIQMFISENEDDELIIENVNKLKKMEEVLKRNFVIIDSKVISIIDKKTGKKLPLASGKISKKELIEIDTYRFLNRYGYDKSISTNEPSYQDTVASEISRIVEYIKSSGVL